MHVLRAGLHNFYGFLRFYHWYYWSLALGSFKICEQNSMWLCSEWTRDYVPLPHMGMAG